MLHTIDSTTYATYRQLDNSAFMNTKLGKNLYIEELFAINVQAGSCFYVTVTFS
jgi:hypothetical protein